MLRFREDGSFLIAQFTDTHLTAGTEPDQKTAALIAEVLDAEKPDLAVLTGDVVHGAANDTADSALAWKIAVDPMEARGIPWAAAFGNHDDEGPMTRAQLMAAQRRFSGCLTQAGPPELPGLGNYVLELAGRDGGAARRLFFLDSLGEGPKGVSRYAWISFEQVAWFRREAAKAPGIPGLAFFHIPLPEYDELWRSQPCHGSKFEEVCAPSLNSGFFAACVETKAVEGIFVGHDHVNDYWGELHGIRLCYGRGTGFNCYGRPDYRRGARMIRLTEGKTGFETWLRLEGGSRDEQPDLHPPSAV